MWSQYDLCLVRNTAYCVKLSGEDLTRYSSKIESAGLRKCATAEWKWICVVVRYSREQVMRGPTQRPSPTHIALKNPSRLYPGAQLYVSWVPSGNTFWPTGPSRLACSMTGGSPHLPARQTRTTENEGEENAGASKMQRLKMWEWINRHQTVGLENARQACMNSQKSY